MDITKFNIGTPVIIKTEDDIYDSYISAITLSDENFVYFKSGSIRATLLDKLKANSSNNGNKFDVSGGVINGRIQVNGALIPKSGIVVNGQKIIDFNASGKSMAIGKVSEAEADEKVLEVDLESKFTKQIYMGGNKVLSFVVTDSWS